MSSRKLHLPVNSEPFDSAGLPGLKDLMCGVDGLLPLGDLQRLVGTAETAAAQREQSKAIAVAAIERMMRP